MKDSNDQISEHVPLKGGILDCAAPDKYPIIDEGICNRRQYRVNISYPPTDVRYSINSILEDPFDVFLEKLAQLEFDSGIILTVIEDSTYTREIFDRGINKEGKYLKSWMQIRERKDNIGETIKYIQELLDGSSRSEKTQNNPIIVYNRKGFSDTYAKILFCLLDIYQNQYSKKTP